MAEKGGGERLDSFLKCREVNSNLFHRHRGMAPLREPGPSIHGRTRVV